MGIVRSLASSFAHDQNGMTLPDMEACLAVATKHREVIIFRSTGPWAKRWLEHRSSTGALYPYPSKSFHAKGKSSDWGPHAGLVSFDGQWSKVGANEKKAAKGTDDNKKGILSGFVGKTTLTLTTAQLERQRTEPAGGRLAIDSQIEIPNSPDLMLVATRSGSSQRVVFRARKRPDDEAYEIWVYPLTDPRFRSGDARAVFEADKFGLGAVPLEVMTSNEVGAKNRPMTGDYDLFAVCPPWSDYGSLSSRKIEKPGILLVGNAHRHPGQTFEAGVGMDNVLDTRNHTMGSRPMHDFRNRLASYRSHTGKTRSPDSLQLMTQVNAHLGDISRGEEDFVGLEHNDMGNLSPRVLRTIVELNKAMLADDTTEAGALRRVHHNAEVSRYRLWFALTAVDMITKKEGERFGDGFPLTVFQPANLNGNPHVGGYGPVCTLETREDFRTYAAALKDAGYYVPKNWIWEMDKSDDQLRAPILAKIRQDLEGGVISEAEARARIATVQE